MSFFTVFSFYLPIFDKDQPISDKNRPEVAIGWFIGVPSFHCSSIVSGAFRPNFTDFRRILPKFSKTIGIGDVRFS
jgi:hypothetical protein